MYKPLKVDFNSHEGRTYIIILRDNKGLHKSKENNKTVLTIDIGRFSQGDSIILMRYFIYS